MSRIARAMTIYGVTGKRAAEFISDQHRASAKPARIARSESTRAAAGSDGVFANGLGVFHLPCGCAWVSRGRRGKVFASRMSCATLRIFSAKGSRASFWRISGFITLAASVYAVAARSPNTFCRGRPVAVVARCGPCPWPVPRWPTDPRPASARPARSVRSESTRVGVSRRPRRSGRCRRRAGARGRSRRPGRRG